MISNHILTEISQTCDRVLVLQNGKLAFSGTEEDLSSRMSAKAAAIKATVLGDAVKLHSALESATCVADYDVADSEGDVHTVIATLADASPEAFAAAMVGAELGLRSLTGQKSELESLFIELTGTED